MTKYGWGKDLRTLAKKVIIHSSNIDENNPY